MQIGGSASGAGNNVSSNYLDGILVDNQSSAARIEGNVVGEDATGFYAFGNGTNPTPGSYSGIHILGASNTTIGGSTGTTPGGACTGACNVLAGNSTGIEIENQGGNLSSHATLLGNYVGLTRDGTQGLVNGNGVDINSDHATVGGTDPNQRNVISSAGSYGLVVNAAADTTTIAGNYVGTDAAGTHDLGSSASGVFLPGGSTNTMIGGPAAGAGNVISGNNGAGIDCDSGGTTIQANTIGLAGDGETALGNGGYGIFNSNNTSGNTIAANVIAANGSYGISMGSAGNTVQGNFIGTNSVGAPGLGNGDGIFLVGDGNTIGGTTAAARNVISGNHNDGIVLAASNNTIQGNYIGITPDGASTLGNGLYGIEATSSGTAGNVIGGSSVIGGAAGPRNVISGNAQAGITVQGGAGAQTIQGNYIGTNAAGDTAIGNAKGVTLYQPMTLGGSNAGEGNLISGNRDAQVELNAADTVAGNVIGLDAAGTGNLNQTYGGSKADAGVDVFAPGAVIGGGGGAHNVISGAGINVWIESPATNATVKNNYIGTNVSGTAGVVSPQVIQRVIVEASNAMIGGPTSGDRNVISGSDFGGVTVDAAAGTSVFNNYIGTDKTGTVKIGNYEGVIVTSGSTNTHIGGGPSEGNLISGNTWGIYIDGGSTGTVVDDNAIGPEASGGSGIGNGVGVDVRDTSTVTVDASYKNTIAYNTGAGVAIDTNNGRGATIRLNSIHDNGGLGIDIGQNGVTANDSGYGHQNFPVITSADNSGVVKFTLDTTAATYQIDIFRSTSCDGSGNGEGQTSLVGRQLVVGSTGSQTYSEAGISLAPGEFVTATATGANGSGDTSEFSNCVQVTSAGPQTYTVDRVNDSSGGTLACTAAPNDCDLRSAITLSNASAGDKDTIAFAVPASSTIQPTARCPTSPIR